MKHFIIPAVAASALALAGVALAQTSTSTIPGANATKEQAARTGAPPPATDNAGSTGTMNRSSSSGGANMSTGNMKTPEQAARNDGVPVTAQETRRVTAMMGRMDANNDGMVSRAEFMQYHEAAFDRMPKDASGNYVVKSSASSRKP